LVKTTFHVLFIKKEEDKSQYDAVLNGTVGLLLPLYTQRQGKKKFLSPATPLSLSYLQED
jgi:hypothetical protein